VISVTRRQYSEPLVRERVRIKSREFLDGPNSVYEEVATAGRPSRPSSPLSPELHVLRVSEGEAQRIRERLAGSEEYELVADRPIRRSHRPEDEWYKEDRRARRAHRHRRRSRSRMTSEDFGENGKRTQEANTNERVRRRRNSRTPSDYVESPHMLPPIRAPTPALLERRRSKRRSFLSGPADDDIEIRRTSQHEALDHRGRPTIVNRRMKSRSRSRSGSRWNAPFGGRPPSARSETTEIVERSHPLPATEDYDWYDSHGQRVRVREI
jgi:hypothetical protein